MIEQEEFCHYKFKDYNRRARHERLRERLRHPSKNRGRLREWLTFTYLTERLALSFDWIIWKWFLGYGMRARRVLLTATGIIFIFAFIYWQVSGWEEDWGSIGWNDGDRRCNVWSPTTISNEASWTQSLWTYGASFLRCLYFSIVTFTTLGYGDYTPEGLLAGIACLQALIGGVLIAFLTVVFARKFIR